MSRSAPRTFTSVLLALIALVLTAYALVAGWMHQELINTDRWTQTSVEVLRDPEVQEVTAEYLADQLVAQQATINGIAAALPPSLQGFAGTASSALRSLAERTALNALETRQFEDLWTTASRDTHQQFLRWLDGQRATSGGAAVSLDLQPALKRLARRIGVPDALISASAGIDANVPIIGAGQYRELRDRAHALEQSAAIALLLAVVVSLLSIAVAVTGRRLWATARIGAAIAAAGGLILLLAPNIGDWLIDELTTNGTAAPVAEAIWRITQPDLTNAATMALIGGGTAALLCAGVAGLVLRER